MSALGDGERVQVALIKKIQAIYKVHGRHALYLTEVTRSFQR